MTADELRKRYRLDRQTALRIRGILDGLEAEPEGESFRGMLLRLIRERGLENAEVYRRAGIDRRHFSKLVTGEGRRTGKATVLRLGLALELGEEELLALLAAQGYTLSECDPLDRAVRKLVREKVYESAYVGIVLRERGIDAAALLD